MDRFDRINPSLSHTPEPSPPSSSSRSSSTSAETEEANPKLARDPARLNTATLRSPAAPAQPPALFRIARARLPPHPTSRTESANAAGNPCRLLSIAPVRRTMDVLGPGQGPPLSLAPCGDSPLRRESPCPGSQRSSRRLNSTASPVGLTLPERSGGQRRMPTGFAISRGSASCPKFRQIATAFGPRRETSLQPLAAYNS